MRLRDLRDIYYGQDIYIVGSGPTSNVFPMNLLKDKICLALNDSYKIHPSITPIALLHHQNYSLDGPSLKKNKFHANFPSIKYPITKATGKGRQKEAIDWDNPYFYFYDWSHDIEKVYQMNKDTDYLYYTPEGCSLHAALQLAWIMGAVNIYIIGCDSSTMEGRHYADYDKNAFRDDEKLKYGKNRDYDSYIKGSLIIQDFLQRKDIQVLNLSPIIGYHMIEEQYKTLKGENNLQVYIDEFRKIGKEVDS